MQIQVQIKRELTGVGWLYFWKLVAGPEGVNSAAGHTRTLQECYQAIDKSIEDIALLHRYSEEEAHG